MLSLEVDDKNGKLKNLEKVTDLVDQATDNSYELENQVIFLDNIIQFMSVQ